MALVLDPLCRRLDRIDDIKRKIDWSMDDKQLLSRLQQTQILATKVGQYHHECKRKTEQARLTDLSLCVTTAGLHPLGVAHDHGDTGRSSQKSGPPVHSPADQVHKAHPLLPAALQLHLLLSLLQRRTHLPSPSPSPLPPKKRSSSLGLAAGQYEIRARCVPAAGGPASPSGRLQVP